MSFAPRRTDIERPLILYGTDHYRSSLDPVKAFITEEKTKKFLMNVPWHVSARMVFMLAQEVRRLRRKIDGR